MSKHTPGPWKLDLKGSRFVIQGIDGRIIAKIQTHIGELPLPHAEKVYSLSHLDTINARLIAAAPCLLEALKFTVSELEILHDDFKLDENRVSTDKNPWQSWSDILDSLQEVIKKAEGN